MVVAVSREPSRCDRVLGRLHDQCCVISCDFYNGTIAIDCSETIVRYDV